jgi:hypothetical protein
MPYSRSLAIQQLEELGWRDYGRKHGESVFTRFFQAHYLMERFGYDKRRPHLSSRIMSGEIVREEALADLAEPLYAEDELAKDKAFILKKLGLDEREFETLLSAPRRLATEYPSSERLYQAMKWVQRIVERRILRRSLARFS